MGDFAHDLVITEIPHPGCGLWAEAGSGGRRDGARGQEPCRLACDTSRAQAQKRGGGREALSLDFEEAEGRYLSDAKVDHHTPEVIYEQRWAMTLLDRVLARLSAEFAATGKSDWLARLQPFLVEGNGGKSYREIASETSRSEEAVKKAVQRMRRRYYELFREEIAQIVASPAEVEDELRHLCDVLSR